jgi:integrase
VPPAVRQSAADRHRLAFERIILPHLGRFALADLTPAVLLDFRAALFQRQFKGRTIKVKTVRNILDGNLRALYRDAREVDGLVSGNPFTALKWPRPIQPEPDPFTAEERDTIVDFFWRKRRLWHPWVLTQFWTGMRPSESAALRVGDVDLRRGEVAITKSRDRGMEAAPKTRRSARTIRLLPNVQEALAAMPLPLHAEPTTYFFRNPEGNPITTQWWPRKSWYPVLRILSIRPRKFYATRHTFISWALSQGANLKWIAEYTAPRSR